MDFATPLSHREKKSAPLLGWMKDRRNQFGIKMALAGCLALYLAQILALPQPVWALVTVMMLMLPMYVGAVAEKSLFRAIGTIIGGILAVFVVGNFTSSAPVFLLLASMVVLVCVYFNGGTRAPYAFFLTALTFMVVASRTLETPSIVWQVALFRVEEILVGIFSSLVVTALIWPRYARDDFVIQAREAMRELITVQQKLFGPEPVRIGEQPEASFTGLTQKMRSLIQLGGRESSYFRANSGMLVKIVNTTSVLNQSLLEIAAIREANPHLRLPEKELNGFFRRWLEVLNDLAEGRDGASSAAMATMKAHASKLDLHLEERRAAMHGEPEKLQEVLTVSMLTLLLGDLVKYTEELCESLPQLPGDRETFSDHRKGPPPRRPPIDVFWLKNGIRAAVSVSAALVFCDWIQPPGASLIPVFALLFPWLSRTYVSSTGDLGVFTILVRAAAFGLPWAICVFLLSPLLTNYLWMNLFLGLCFFGLGRMLFPGLPALSLNGLLVLNGLVSTFALNFQEPVTFFDVSSNYLGFVIGIGFAAIFQRLLWPVLPQREFRDRCRDVLRIVAKLLRDCETGENFQANRTEILRQIVELKKWRASIPQALGGEEEDLLRRQLVFLLRRLARVSLRVTELNQRLPSWPGIGQELEDCTIAVRNALATESIALARALATGRKLPPSTMAAQEYPRLCKLAASVFQQKRPQEFSREDWLGWMSLMVRHQILAERIDDLSKKMRQVDLAALSSDPVL